MRKRNFLLPLLFLFSVTTAHASANVRAGELIVGLKSGAKLAESFTSQFALTKKLRATSGNYVLIKVKDGFSIDSVKQELISNDDVRFVEPNFIYTVDGHQVGKTLTSEELSTKSEDPRFGLLWGLNNSGDNEPNRSGDRSSTPGVAGADVSALRAWDINQGSDAIKIAVIDTGVDYNHPDLRENMWVNEAEQNGTEGVDDDGNGFVDDIYGYDFAGDDSDPYDGHSHGTHCAGTIGALHNNGEGVAGVMANVKIVAVKFLSDSGSGSTADAIEAIDYATTVGVDIMSNSWGGGGFSQALKEAIERASDAGIIFTAAAGNSTSNNDNTPHYPSNYEVPNVVSVAAHNAQDSLAYFSSYGSRTVHIAAPGHNILSSVKDGGYAVYSGTSMATPHVTGVLGLLLSEHGRMDHEAMHERLHYTSVPVRAYARKTISGGRIDAYNLLTDHRPERSEPDPDAWVRADLDEVFETAHPYENGADVSRSFSVDGAKYVRLVIEKYELETRYDFLHIKSGSTTLESISGSGENYVTEYADGGSIDVNFTSDSSVNKWGVKIVAIEYIME